MRKICGLFTSKLEHRRTRKGGASFLEAHALRGVSMSSTVRRAVVDEAAAAEEEAIPLGHGLEALLAATAAR